ncbi:hypothetical protein AB0I28_32595 [Phytomonospora sp. NPDC050363]|uniref:hypothetical protein n=1 Tax=Phytomonospora sp. NPDC050363 TaxID=3155642 RepID=UPI0033C13397
MNDPTTLGYGTEPAEVAAIVEQALSNIDDPHAAYSAASSMQVFHAAVAEAFAARRADYAASLADGEDGQKRTTRQVGELLGLSHTMAARLINRGRRARS